MIPTLFRILAAPIMLATPLMIIFSHIGVGLGDSVVLTCLFIAGLATLIGAKK